MRRGATPRLCRLAASWPKRSAASRVTASGEVSGRKRVGSLHSARSVARFADAPKAEATIDLTDPAQLTAKAPATFKVRFETTKGGFTVEATRALAPNGADRFYNLVRAGYFKDLAFFRVIPGFMCQFGIHGDPKVAAAWRTMSRPNSKWPISEGKTAATAVIDQASGRPSAAGKSGARCPCWRRVNPRSGTGSASTGRSRRPST